MLMNCFYSGKVTVLVVDRCLFFVVFLGPLGVCVHAYVWGCVYLCVYHAGDREERTILMVLLCVYVVCLHVGTHRSMTISVKKLCYPPLVINIWLHQLGLCNPLTADTSSYLFSFFSPL